MDTVDKREATELRREGGAEGYTRSDRKFSCRFGDRSPFFLALPVRCREEGLGERGDCGEAREEKWMSGVSPPEELVLGLWRERRVIGVWYLPSPPSKSPVEAAWRGGERLRDGRMRLEELSPGGAGVSGTFLRKGLRALARVECFP